MFPTFHWNWEANHGPNGLLQKPRVFPWFPIFSDFSQLTSMKIRSWALVGTDMHLPGHQAMDVFGNGKVGNLPPKKWEVTWLLGELRVYGG
jgi:hypothetical protein